MQTCRVAGSRPNASVDELSSLINKNNGASAVLVKDQS